MLEVKLENSSQHQYVRFFYQGKEVAYIDSGGTVVLCDLERLSLDWDYSSFQGAIRSGQMNAIILVLVSKIAELENTLDSIHELVEDRCDRS